jgi:hypothetical protein
VLAAEVYTQILYTIDLQVSIFTLRLCIQYPSPQQLVTDGSFIYSGVQASIQWSSGHLRIIPWLSLLGAFLLYLTLPTCAFKGCDCLIPTSAPSPKASHVTHTSPLTHDPIQTTRKASAMVRTLFSVCMSLLFTLIQCLLVFGPQFPVLSPQSSIFVSPHLTSYNTQLYFPY